MRIADRVHVLARGAFTKRLALDYFDTYDEDFEDFFSRLAEHGRTGSFWREQEA